MQTAKQESTRVEYGKVLARLGEENPDIVVLDADLSGSTQTHLFARVFKDRFFNLGVWRPAAKSPLPAPSPSLRPAGLGSRSARPSPTAT